MKYVGNVADINLSICEKSLYVTNSVKKVANILNLNNKRMTRNLSHN